MFKVKPHNPIYSVAAKEEKKKSHVLLWIAAVNTHLENLKAINVQHADAELLMIFHHGFVDGLK